MKKVIPGKVKTQLRLDGYYNVLNKYGTQHDSTEYYQWASGTAVSDAELADLYAGNGLFATIIDAPANDATKNGIDLGIKDKDLQKQLRRPPADYTLSKQAVKGASVGPAVWWCCCRYAGG